MAQDERIRTVIERWAPRFTANGVPLHDFQTVTGALETWDDWCRAWSARAAEHEVAGRAALAAGNDVTAAQYLKTAGVLYHFAKFVFIEDMDQLKAAHRKALDCYNLALPLLDPPGERVEIPFGSHTLYGNLRKPRGVEKPPVVVMCIGMDSTKEEMATNEADFLDRGLATLAFDGPGQGEAEYDLAIEPEYDKPVTAVIDAIAARGDLDANRVGVWGVSFGGYYAPRAAAFEPRIKACAAISGPFDFGALFRAGNLNAVFQVRAHAKTAEEATAVADRITLEGVAGKIACPLFVVGGDLDRIAPPAEQERLAAEAKGGNGGETELLILAGGIHCGHNLRHKYSPHVADWMAARLAG